MLKALLHCAILRATCVATPLREKLNESLPDVTYLATAKNRCEAVVESRIELGSTFRNG